MPKRRSPAVAARRPRFGDAQQRRRSRRDRGEQFVAAAGVGEHAVVAAIATTPRNAGDERRRPLVEALEGPEVAGPSRGAQRQEPVHGGVAPGARRRCGGGPVGGGIREPCRPGRTGSASASTSSGKVITASPASGRPAVLITTTTSRPPWLTTRWIVPGREPHGAPGAASCSRQPVRSSGCSAPRRRSRRTPRWTQCAGAACHLEPVSAEPGTRRVDRSRVTDVPPGKTVTRIRALIGRGTPARARLARPGEGPDRRADLGAGGPAVGDDHRVAEADLVPPASGTSSLKNGAGQRQANSSVRANHCGGWWMLHASSTMTSVEPVDAVVRPVKPSQACRVPRSSSPPRRRPCAAAVGERSGAAPEEPAVAGVLAPLGGGRADPEVLRADVGHARLERQHPAAVGRGGGA